MESLGLLPELGYLSINMSVFPLEFVMYLNYLTETLNNAWVLDVFKTVLLSAIITL